MKICIDGNPIGTFPLVRTGVYRYITSLLNALSKIDKVNEYRVFFSFFRKRHFPYYKKAMLFLERNGFKIIYFPFPPRIWTRLGLNLDYFFKIDIFHGMYDQIYPIKKAKKVVTIHDVRYLDINERLNEEYIRVLKGSPFFKQHLEDYHCRLKFFGKLRKNIYKLVKEVDAIITVSEFSKMRLIKQAGAEEKQIHVICHGVAKAFQRNLLENICKERLKKYNINFPYLLFVGKHDPLKNLIHLMEAFKLIKEEFFQYKLIVVGEYSWFSEVIKKRINELKLEKDVIFTDYLADEVLYCFYQNADVFVFPSLYEGFGMPVLEAMACGTPVVASNVCSLPEIVRDNGILVNPYDVEDIANGIYKILRDNNLRQDLIRKGLSYVKEFTWEKAAKKHIEVYEKLG